MIDAIIRLWNASPVNPAAVAVVGWVVWKLYSAVGPKFFLALGLVVGGAAIFWNGERVLQILTWLGAAYVALNLFGFVGGSGGGSMFSYSSGYSSDEEPVRKQSGKSSEPHDLPFGFDKSVQPFGAHQHGYEPHLDPQNTNKLC